MFGCHDRHERKKSKSACNENQAHKATKRRPIRLTDNDNDYIIGDIKLRDPIEYERKMSVDDSCE